MLAQRSRDDIGPVLDVDFALVRARKTVHIPQVLIEGIFGTPALPFLRQGDDNCRARQRRDNFLYTRRQTTRRAQATASHLRTRRVGVEMDIVRGIGDSGAPYPFANLSPLQGLPFIRHRSVHVLLLSHVLEKWR